MVNILSHSLCCLFILLLLVLCSQEFDFIPTSKASLLSPATTGPLQKTTALPGGLKCSLFFKFQWLQISHIKALLTLPLFHFSVLFPLTENWFFSHILYSDYRFSSLYSQFLLHLPFHLVRSQVQSERCGSNLNPMGTCTICTVSIFNDSVKHWLHVETWHLCSVLLATCLFLCQCHTVQETAAPQQFLKSDFVTFPAFIALGFFWLSGVLWFLGTLFLKSVVDTLIRITSSRRDVKRILIIPIHKHEKPVYFNVFLHIFHQCLVIIIEFLSMPPISPGGCSLLLPESTHLLGSEMKYLIRLFLCYNTNPLKNVWYIQVTVSLGYCPWLGELTGSLNKQSLETK